MTETKQKQSDKKPDNRPITDDQITELALRLQESEGFSLVEAMIDAERRLQPKVEIQTSFDITFTVRPRIAAWILEAFGGHDRFTVEDRLGAFVGQLVARFGSQRRSIKKPMVVTDGEAVTVRPGELAAQAPDMPRGNS